MSNPVAPTTINPGGSGGVLPPSSGGAQVVTGALGQSKVALCHRTEGTNEYVPVTVADPAVETHIAHGDMYVGDPVPDQAGMVFDGSCRPVTPSITYSFTGYLSGDFGTLSGSTPFSGSFTYDAAQTGFPVPDGTVYNISTASLAVGGETPNLDLQAWGTFVSNDSFGADRWEVTNVDSSPPWTIGGLAVDVILFQFVDTTAIVFDSEVLPSAGLRLTDFTDTTMRLAGYDPSNPSAGVIVESALTSLTSTSVP